MRRTRDFLTSGLVLVSFAACVVSASPASAWGHRAKGHLGRSQGPVALGPWVRDAWDRTWAYGEAPGYAGWGVFGADAASEAYYPWGYTAPYFRIGHLCVANQFATDGMGVYVRYQKVRPAIYCEPQ